MATRLALGTTAVLLGVMAAVSAAAHAEVPDDDDDDDDDADARRLDERTALTMGARHLKLGVLAFDYGITDRLEIGTDPPAWAARAVISVLVPNLHVKVVLLRRERLWISLWLAGYYASLTRTSAASGHLLALPLSVFVSGRVHPRVWLHGEGTWTEVRAFGAGDVRRTEVSGASATRNAQAGLMTELRLTRVVALTLRGRYQIYTGDLAFEATTSPDDRTQIDVDGRLTARIQHPWVVVGGVALLWRHVHLLVGAGYGHYFIPGLDVSLPREGFTPDGSLSVVF